MKLSLKMKQVQFIITVAFILLYAQNLILIPSVMIDVLVLVYLIISCCEKKLKVRISYKTFLNESFIIPLFVWILFSIIIEVSSGFSLDYMQHSLTFLYRSILYFGLMKDTINTYKEKTPDYLLIACIIAYIPAMLTHFIRYGLINGIVIIFMSDYNNMSLDLEVHGLTYVFGFLAVSYFYSAYVGKERKRLLFVISTIMMALGLKRIVFAATFFVILLIIVLLKFKCKKQKMIKIISVLMIFASYIYIYILKNGILENLYRNFNIADNFRMIFANYLNGKYEVIPSFIGYGMAYSHRIIVHEYTKIQYLTAAVNIHNDLLGIYLGTGFFGFGIYWFIFFYKRCSILQKKYGMYSSFFSLMISIYYFINMLVSNIGLDPFYYSVYFMTIAVINLMEKRGGIGNEGMHFIHAESR